MSRRTPTLLWWAFVGLCLPTVAQSQLIVSDPGNLFANTVTSVQSTLTALVQRANRRQHHPRSHAAG